MPTPPQGPPSEPVTASGSLDLVAAQLQLLREDEVRAVAVGQVVLNLRPATAVESGDLEVPPASATRCATRSRGCRSRWLRRP
eukprot:9303423-Pyramimonas_sp.AAC.1